MAASLNPVKAKLFKTKLDKLGCPYTQDVEEGWISELLFKPGESRIRLLQWLFSKFDSKLNEILDPQYASAESKVDSRIQRLLYVASTLGLCREDDVDLIRGVVKSSKQSAFMEHLIDIVCIADSAEDPKNKLLREPGIVCDEMPLEEQLAHDVAYLNTLCNHGNIEAVFDSRVTLLPPDLMKLVEDGWKSKGYTKEKPPKPDFHNIENSAIQLADDIQRQKQLLEELQKKYDYQKYDRSKLDAMCKTISLVLSELSQLVTGFTYCFENEMKHWCNKDPPALTQLGPAFKRVHRLLQQFVQVLQGFKSIRSSYTSLNRVDEDGHVNMGDFQTKTTNILVNAGEEALQSLQEVVVVLEDSIHHSEVNSSTPSTPRSVRSQASTLKNYGDNQF